MLKSRGLGIIHMKLPKAPKHFPKFPNFSYTFEHFPKQLGTPAKRHPQTDYPDTSMYIYIYINMFNTLVLHVYWTSWRFPHLMSPPYLACAKLYTFPITPPFPSTLIYNRRPYTLILAFCFVLLTSIAVIYLIDVVGHKA